MSNSAVHHSTSASNTKQLFATHSLADLASIAAKLRADVAKRDAQLATALADEYPHLLSACDTILGLKKTTLSLCDATVALNTNSFASDAAARDHHAPGVTVVLHSPPSIPHSHAAAHAARAARAAFNADPPVSHDCPSFIHILDHAWSDLCNGDFASAINHLNTAAEPTSLTPPHLPSLKSMCQTTLTRARPLVAVDFVRHAASCALSSSDPTALSKLQSEYALVQDYSHLPDLAQPFLHHHHTAILSSLVPNNPKSVQQAVLAAIHVHIKCLTQLHLPLDQVNAWTQGLQTALASWIQAHRTPPPASVVDQVLAAAPVASPVVVGESWSTWLAKIHLTLQQDAVHAVLAELRLAIARHVAASDTSTQLWVTGGSAAGEERAAPPKDLQPLHAKVQVLVAELLASAGGGASEFFHNQVNKVLGDLAPADAPIDVTVRSLIAAGHVLGTWPQIHAHLTPLLDQWTRTWCVAHAHVLDQPCAVGDLPTPGLVEVLFELLSEVQALGLLSYSFVIKHILRTTAARLAAHYVSRPLTSVPADVVLADMALVDRVCGTTERDQVATSLGINGPAHDATRAAASALASAAMQSWGILLQSTAVDPPVAAVAASAPLPDLPPGFTLDPVDRMGPLLPPVPVAGGPTPGLSIVTVSGPGAASLVSSSSSRHGSNALLPIDPAASSTMIQSPLKHSPLPNGGHLLFGARAAKFWTQTRHLFGGAGDVDDGQAAAKQAGNT